MLLPTVTEIVRELEPVAPDPFIAAIEAVRPRPTGHAGLVDSRHPSARPIR